MNIKRGLLTLLFGVSVILAQAMPGLAQIPSPNFQSESAPAVTGYLELVGNGGIYTVNTDVIFPRGWGFRVGVSPFVDPDSPVTYIDEQVDDMLFLVMAQRLYGTGLHRLETGAGLILSNADDLGAIDLVSPAFTFTLGYRKHPNENSKFLFRAGLTPILSGDNFYLRGGISIGWLLGGGD